MRAYQHGAIARDQALVPGNTKNRLRQKLRDGGSWQRLLPGIYLSMTGAPTLDQLETAALLRAGPGTLLTGAAALRRYGLRCPDTRFSDVLIPATRKRMSCSYVRVQGTRRPPAGF